MGDTPLRTNLLRVSRQSDFIWTLEVFENLAGEFVAVAGAHN
ncbi:MAG: hypothetical protein G01um101416_668 [Microgenomates group bacterium Gr01-1014_16]|nr:MAG: hypothetical protein G01um101416_668 [Microgenomates group bacterium Gr01-1014_16]